MKTIKYFVMLIAAVALFSGCSDDDDPSTQNRGKTKPTVTVTKGQVTDTKFIFNLAASEEASQYAYAVFEGKDNTAPIARDIMLGEVSGAEQTGAFNVADAAAKDVSFECDSALDYQIFATAITPTGLLGEVTELTIYVPDTINPTPKSFSTSGNTAKVTFDEDIVVGTTGKATVQYVQWGAGKISAAVDIPMENISTSGAVATIVCPKPGNGAGYVVSFTAGLFEDPSGNKAPGITSSINPSTGKYTNIGWNDANVAFPIEKSYFVAQTASDDFVTPASTINFAFPFDVYDSGIQNAVQVIYNEKAGISYMNATYSLEADKRTVKVTLPRGATGALDVQVAAGAFYDVWDNETAAFTVAPADLRYSYIYNLTTGTYSVTYPSLAGQVVNPDAGTPFTLDFVKYNATYYALYNKWFGKYQAPILLGKVDFAKRTVTFDGTYLSGQTIKTGAFGGGFYYYDQAQTQMLAFWGGGSSGTEPIVVDFDDVGKLTDISYFDYTIHDAASGSGLAVFDALLYGTMSHVPSQPTPAPIDPVAAYAPYATFPTPLTGVINK